MKPFAFILIVVGLCTWSASTMAQMIGTHARGTTIGQPAAPAGAPTQGPAGTNALSGALLQLGQPTGLTSTQDPTVCTQHGGLGAGLACKALLPKGQFALIWNWTGSNRISGFHIYSVDGSGQQVHFGDQPDGPGVTVFVADPGGSTACYMIQAYESDIQAVSPWSDAYCPGGGTVQQNASFQPIQMRSYGRGEIKGSGVLSDAFGPGTDTWFGGSFGLRVGYSYDTAKHAGADQAVVDLYRTGLLFDLQSLHGKTIVAAHLKMIVYAAWLGPAPGGNAPGGTPSDRATSCVGAIGAASGGDWWYQNGWIDGDIVLKPGPYQGPDVAMDVTKMVQDWANGTPNSGFVLEGGEENENAFTEEGCVTEYVPGGFALDVQFR